MTDWETHFREISSRHPVSLSAAGAERRRGMLEQLMGESVARGRRRHALRAGAAATLATGLLLASLALPWHPSESGVRIEIVRDVPGILARLAPPAPPIPPETWVDDDELLSLLATSDRATGLIRAGDRVILTAQVTDDLQ